MKVSREGWQWTPSSGLKAGLPSIGVIEPAQNFQSVNETLDVIVIGAGYTGLTAARDTSTNGSYPNDEASAAHHCILFANTSCRVEDIARRGARQNRGANLVVEHRWLPIRDGRNLGPLVPTSCIS